jgi:hypothetical protein
MGRGFEISLPGGGSKNSKTGQITPPKSKSTFSPVVMTPKQYDAMLKKVIADMKKTKR